MLSKGDIKRRTREQTRQFERLKKLRHHPLWSEVLTARHFDEFEDMAADSADDELAAVVLRLVDELKAKIRHENAAKSMAARESVLGHF